MAYKPQSSSPKEFKVRLSRTSSAQGALKQERRKSTAPYKVDDIISEDKSVDTVTGKLPVEAAYVIMKRVTNEVGHKLNPVGKSTFNRLNSLKTGPAVELLAQKTWREFFSKKTAEHEAMANMNSNRAVETFTSSVGLPSNGATGNGSGTDEQVQRQREVKAQLQQIFSRLVGRVEHLWNFLKIPKTDRTFYRKSLCKGPPQSLEQCREVAVYITVLKAHKEATVAVVQAIQVREMTITKCFDVLAALQRKFSRNNGMRDTGGAASSSFSQFQPQQHQHQQFGSSSSSHSLLGGTGGGGGSNFWKEELISVLDEVRTMTLEVIKRIQQWRRNLWRPHPFVYMGRNYVSKMKDDLSILESDMYVRLLQLVPLRLDDLQCIVFYSGASKIVVDTTPAAAASPFGGTGSTVPLNNANNSPLPFARSQQQQQQYRSNAFSNSPGPYGNTYTAGVGGGAGGGGGGGIGFNNTSSNGGDPNKDRYIQQMLSDFLRRVDVRELNAAATVVLEEEMLQHALAIEQASLARKGVFIPTLHVGPVGSRGLAEIEQQATVLRSAEPHSHSGAGGAGATHGPNGRGSVGEAAPGPAGTYPGGMHDPYSRFPQQQQRYREEEEEEEEEGDDDGEGGNEQHDDNEVEGGGGDQDQNQDRGGGADGDGEVDWSPDFA
jgi:hypothetical protein